ncbi:hypothetical protein KC19_6G017300 [Ceratodon purpureus]|uniref:Protein kinase domain-containing protein n=1 Tax=Ceratodon purpureus TaxID=3225 RepID=A0A8T0HBW3_CERPU|nr:hypothetical protein KC19_6G017300 [Ceratodon purpureus]
MKLMDQRLWLLLLLVLIVLKPTVHAQAQNFSSFSFPTFTSTDKLLINRDAEYMRNSSSIWLNPIYNGSFSGLFYSCGELIYSESIQMRSNTSTTGGPPAVASFETSFTFSMTGNNSAGMAFMFAVENYTTGSAGASLCLLQKQQNGRATNHVFAVEFDTWQNPEFNDPSNNHVGVNVNNMNSTAVYNYCGNLNYCSYFDTDQDFTAWIEYDSTTQIVVVFMTNGSLIQNVTKPANPIIQASHIDLTNVFNDYMYVGFTGSGAMYPEIKRIKSWNFKTRSFGSVSIPVIQSNPKQDTSKTSWVGIIAGVVSAVCGLIIAILCIVYFMFRRRGKPRGGGDAEGALSMDQLLWPREFSFQELSIATNGFSEDCLLGEGGFGQVFKGTFKLRTSGYQSHVAVKRTKMKESSKPGTKEFLAELSVISQIRHRNLVRLYGWCQENKNLLLVFEYMPNRSLEKWLFHKQGKKLTWQQRQHIMTGVAAALGYLHEGWNQCILHRDIKAANVLLDEEFNPHVGDFGLARITDHSKMGRTTAVAGTFGYLAPETAQDGKATQKSDVYSFGILALEVASGRPVLRLDWLDENDDEEPVNLLECAWHAHERGELLKLVDPRLGSEFDAEEVNRMFQLGLLCCHPDPDARPVMRVVHQCMVDGEVDQLVASLPPFKPRVQYYVGAINDSRRNERHSLNSSHSSSTGVESLNSHDSSSGSTWRSSGSTKFLIP